MGKSKDLATGETRFVNTAGDTMTGTLVAGTRLQVGDSSITQQYPSYGYVADFQASSGTQTYISIAAPTASSLGDNGVIIGEDATDTYITQRGNKNIKLATQDLVRLTVDGSGNVTTPYQPMFRIRTAGVTSVNGTSSGVNLAGSYYQSSTLVQAGSHFAVSTGRFTAPVAGYYFFNFSNRVDQVGSDYIYFTIFDGGGSVITRNLTSVNTTYQTLHCSAVWYMSANDYVFVRYDAQADAYVNLDSDGFFSGFLVG